MMHTHGKIPLIGCGILKNEILYLIEKNRWDVRPHFLCSSLHTDFEKLEKTLTKAMASYGTVPKGVVYGTCHPNMEGFLERGNAIRPRQQNCVELLLGRAAFETHLSSGAFFIMEDWARRWELITGLAFGRKQEIVKEIFASEHTHLVAIKTPCSTDFEPYAERIMTQLDLPLKWVTVRLDHLEKTLGQMLSEIRGA